MRTASPYSPELWVDRAGTYVKYATSSAVTVTDPGWDGTFAAPSEPVIRKAAGQSVTVGFGWDRPLEGTSAVVRSSDGAIAGGCSGTAATSCGANLQVSAGQLTSYWTEIGVTSAAGDWIVFARSAPVVVTALSEEALADVLTGGTDAQLATLLGPQASQDKIAALRRAAELAVMDEAACFAIGAADPTHPVDATPSTTQMACSAGSKAALAALVANLGVTGAITALVDYAFSHPEAPSSGGGSGGGTVVNPQPADPDPTPSPDPGGTGGTGGSGGGSGGSNYFCEVEGPSGEVYKLSYNELGKHIIDYHTPGGPNSLGKSLWGEDLRETVELGNFICDALEYTNPVARDEASPEDIQDGEAGWALRFQSEQPSVGTLKGTTELTNRFTVVVRPDGSVSTAYPGW